MPCLCRVLPVRLDQPRGTEQGHPRWWGPTHSATGVLSSVTFAVPGASLSAKQDLDFTNTLGLCCTPRCPCHGVEGMSHHQETPVGSAQFFHEVISSI